MTITVGHIGALLGLIDLAAALLCFASWWRVRGYGYGTPLYARGRDSKRLARLCAVSGILLLAIARFTPLWALEVA